MPRRPREEAADALHHVVAKGNKGDAIVHDDRDRRRFVDRLERAVVRHGWICLAYCLLDNHFHLLVQTPTPNLGAGMRWLQSAHAQDLNFRYARTGHVFGGRYYSVRVKDEEHLLSAIAYVSLNPVRAGIVARAEDWPWSSYAATAGLAPSPLFLAKGAVLELFDARQGIAERRFVVAVNETLERDVVAGRGV